MREILFRAKRADNGEWVEGYYFIDERDIEDGFIQREIPQIQQRYGDHFNYFDIIPETVGQYTGRLAEEEKKIFEGDLCTVTTFDYNGRDYQHEVAVEECGGGFYFVGEKEDFFMAVAEVEDTETDVEVIGNIHNKPELQRR